MIDSSWSKKELTDFQGAWTLREESDVPSIGALLALNCQFNPGQVSKRFGYGTALSPSDAATALFNLIFTDAAFGPKNLLLWYANNSGKVRYADLSSPTPTDIYTQAGAYAACFAAAGSRAYISHFDANGSGVGNGRVYSYGVGADALFARPMLTTEVGMSPSYSAGGDLTPGTHKIGFIMTTRNGYRGRPSPITTLMAFTPTDLVVGTSNKTATITVTPTTTWPAYATSIQLIMSTASNSAVYYYVPGQVLSVPAGGGLAVNFTGVSISDQSLTKAAAQVSIAQQNLLTQDYLGNAPFNPIAVCEYGNRMVYVFNTATLGQGVFVSEKNNYQAISADQHIIYLPGQKRVTTAFTLGGGSLYLVGPNWTYSISDTGDVPVTWPAPKQVDGSIGTLSIRGVAINPASGTGWVAHTSGLYRFQGGSYDSLPTSYEQSPEWSRINWQYAQAVQVLDDATRKRVVVIAPLDAATSPSHILVWDYTNGTSPEQVKFSLDNIASFSPGSCEIVQNYTSKRLELWLGAAATGDILRQKNAGDTNPYRDRTNSAINWVYETALLPGVDAERGQIHQHHGGHFIAKGLGSLAASAYGLDKQTSFSMGSISLSTLPGLEYFLPCDLIAESIRLRFSNNTVDEYAVISLLRWYYSQYVRFR